MLKRNLRISYPAGRGRIVLRSEVDWEKDIEATSVNEEGTTYTFEISAERPFLYVDPCLITNDGTFHWAVGASKLILMERDDDQVIYPYFFDSEQGHVSELIELSSPILGHKHTLRCYLPPGYNENTLAVYPVAFLHDTLHLLFPEEAFRTEPLSLDNVERMQSALKDVADFIMVGISMHEDEKEGDAFSYEDHASALLSEIVPHVQNLFRIGSKKKYRSVWGTKLGGLIAFNSAWQYPDFFGGAVCMSSPFANYDRLMEQVLKDPKRDVEFYIDSRCTDEQHEDTMAMAVTLASRGWQYGNSLFYQCFPKGTAEEDIWGIRMQLPMQFLYGPVANAIRKISGEDIDKLEV